MATLRKKNPNWKPHENQGLLVGDTIEISDYRRLVESGDAELVDDNGNVLPLPGTVFVCGICFDKIESHADYVQHVMDQHAETKTKKPDAFAAEIKTEELEKEKEIAEEERRKAIGQRLAAARAAKKAEKNG